MLTSLRPRFSPDDWADVAGAADEVAAFHVEVEKGLPEIARLTSPDVQYYLKAITMLDGWQERLDAIRTTLGALHARPAELEAELQQARQQLAGLVDVLQQAEDLATREQLLLPTDLLAATQGAGAGLRTLQTAAGAPPVGVRRLAGDVARQLDSAHLLLDGVTDVSRRAAQARQQLDQARRDLASALSYEQYDHRNHAGTARGALSAAEAALAIGLYDQAMTESGRAMESCQGLTEAYQEHVRALELAQQEEQRRAQEASQAALAASSSSSNNTSTGGGGSWDSSSSSSSSSDSGSGGGGNW